MKKTEFLLQLHDKLSGLPQDDVEERLAFYKEMIDDRIDEGFSEEDAVAQIGNIEQIVTQIIADTPFSKLVKEKLKPKKRLRIWAIVLLAVGSPIWLSLLIAALAVMISLYAVLWSGVISLWAGFTAVCACVLGFLVGGFVLVRMGYGRSGIALFGGSILCAGLSIFLFYGCKAATKGTAWLTKQGALGIKRCFITKEVT
jgi:uncharacterized membrane protein